MLSKDYSFSARLLHKLALGSRLIAEASFDIEHALNKVDPSTIDESPVFVSGLARSGTTILMRVLHQTNAFRSLTYRDMPFVLMPATWKKLSSNFQQDMQARERAHKDSIIVDYDSPEAFEEVFWRIFYGKQYIKDEHLEKHVLNSQARKKFREYIGSVLASVQGGDNLRYLSKNNNNLLRLETIKKSFPGSAIIIPFRDPVQHALSLYRQHQHFVSIQSNDSFALKYMNWLGHHEFGLNHKPFLFPDQSIETSDKSWDSAEYWLAQWINTYNYMLEQAPESVVFLSYEDLCLNSANVIERLMALLNIPYNPIIGNGISQADIHPGLNVDKKVLAASRDTYRRLLEKKF